MTIRYPVLMSAALLAAPAASADALSLRLPLACEIGRTCFIQHYVDRDPGSGARDYTCGSRTYDGHDGIDIRLSSRPAAAGPAGAVLAAAPGRVLRTRGDAADVSVRETGRDAVAGVECGNGAVIAHADGYETQYCHLAKGSLTVRPGDTVAAGQAIGQVGLSGASEFPHLHFTLRRNGRMLDPFAPTAPAEACLPAGALPPDNLWDASVQPALAYRAGAVLNAGFSGGPVGMAEVETEATGSVEPASGALVAWIRTIGLDTGDAQRLVLQGPDGRVLAENADKPLARPRAQTLIFAGKKRPAAGWGPGTYTATYTVWRAGSVALQHSFSTTLAAR